MHILQINSLGKIFIKEASWETNTAKILPNKMQPYIRYKEINERLYVEGALKTVSLRY